MRPPEAAGSSAAGRLARACLVAGATLGCAGVAGGAFGAHALRARLAPEELAAFETAMRYLGWHAPVLLAIGLLAERRGGRLLAASAACFAAGVLLFSGSLALLALTGVREFGWFTPFGGLALMAGWLLLALAGWRRPPAPTS